MTPTQLAAIEATLAEARPLPDTGHKGSCGCPDCRTVWQHADGIPAAAARLARVHVPDLIAEVRRLSEAAPVIPSADVPRRPRRHPPKRTRHP